MTIETEWVNLVCIVIGILLRDIINKVIKIRRGLWGIDNEINNP